ncbi:hypothetical protein MJO28_001085 [Puccinia striiformis f. sp. tritici]|uniref:Uncharacterized protein n=1 Tax=Puccinia striiformis f. sp. tritici TaxID=168172 RepID=A0ACC0F0R2_9BASI|nr:hypothetical protein MJO28_001085 [Puccinia striiformis f. sp. tritici]KAI7966889.1 hypothetical protein MJO29_000166 [Puccinia striiformis f. sp. tritici]
MIPTVFQSKQPIPTKLLSADQIKLAPCSSSSIPGERLVRTKLFGYLGFGTKPKSCFSYFIQIEFNFTNLATKFESLCMSFLQMLSLRAER